MVRFSLNPALPFYDVGAVVRLGNTLAGEPPVAPGVWETHWRASRQWHPVMEEGHPVMGEGIMVMEEGIMDRAVWIAVFAWMTVDLRVPHL